MPQDMHEEVRQQQVLASRNGVVGTVATLIASWVVMGVSPTCGDFACRRQAASAAKEAAGGLQDNDYADKALTCSDDSSAALSLTPAADRSRTWARALAADGRGTLKSQGWKLRTPELSSGFQAMRAFSFRIPYMEIGVSDYANCAAAAPGNGRDMPAQMSAATCQSMLWTR